LYVLTAAFKKRDGPLIWTSEARAAFDRCRNALANTVRLAYTLPDCEIRVTTDASNNAVGAILEQFFYGTWQPLGFSLRNSHLHGYATALMIVSH